jgi:ketosteroid isomerase-like protein
MLLHKRFHGDLEAKGKGFAAAFRGFSGRIRIDSKQDIREIHAAGDLAYCCSYISVVMTNVENGEESRRAGYVLTIFRRSAGGTWLLSRDANLLTPEETSK